jgi:hypothetical protein
MRHHSLAITRCRQLFFKNHIFLPRYGGAFKTPPLFSGVRQLLDFKPPSECGLIAILLTVLRTRGARDARCTSWLAGPPARNWLASLRDGASERALSAASLTGPICPATARRPADSLAPLPAGQPASHCRHYSAAPFSLSSFKALISTSNWRRSRSDC